MAILISKLKMTDEDLAKFIRKRDKHLKRIVRAWQESKIAHSFKNEGLFKEAVRENLKTLDFPDVIDMLFTPCNFFFSTQENGTLETLYFMNCARNQTGRLRQEHTEGPLAKIDKKSKTHLFLSSKRFRSLKEWHHRHKHKAPQGIEDGERRPKNGTCHIEYAYDENEKKISGWHKSRGLVNTSESNLPQRIASALENTIGDSY
jgi:hypothetical protein